MMKSSDYDDVSEFEKKSIMSRGAFGTVYKIRWNGKLYACKQSIVKGNKVPQSASFELDALKTLKHKYLIKMIAYQFRTEYDKLIVNVFMELAKVDLKHFLDNSLIVSHGLKKIFIKQIIVGLTYMHAKKYMHGDIKIENILISMDFVVKICDFGHCRPVVKDKKHSDPIRIGTRIYQAPELLLEKSNFDETIDLWSLGILIYKIVTMYYLFPEKDIDKLLQLMCQILGPINESSWPGVTKLPGYPRVRKMTGKCEIDLIMTKSIPNVKIVELIKNLIILDPQKRKPAKQLLNLPYFR
ncbi:hypothetical protein A3Q56_04518 [Intoshia linei]|uniref:Protein kinase domain-containing protein n=1 Tax=Intoshia linei TaxID=1819745 RepID=A0A177B0B0_9BILA|nr:hypothetical protein A3Q56_04518 [Intoshia linei]